MNYFECKISHEKVLENGKESRVTDTYLVDALSFTEAEARIIEQVTPFISGEFKVESIKREKIAEIFSEDQTGDRWFKAVLGFITIDERSGKEKKSKSNMVILAGDFDSAKENLVKGMKGTMADYVILSIKETDIIDIYKYNG